MRIVRTQNTWIVRFYKITDMNISSVMRTDVEFF